MNIKKLSKDTIFTISSIFLYNVVVQFIVYPCINSFFGKVLFGNIVYYLSFVSIFSVAVGTSVNNERLIFEDNNQSSTKNGILTVIVLLLIVIPIFIVYEIITKEKIHIVVICCVIIILTTFRYYADVYFRLKKNFLNYFLYYVILCIGYLTGVLLLKSFNLWFLPFLIGELLPLIFILLLRNKNTTEKMIDNKIYTNTFFKESFLLATSYFVYNVSLNFDRIIIQNVMGSNSVAEYYVSSLIGKTIAFLIGPLNTIVITYGISYLKEIDIKKYLKIVLCVVAISSMVFMITLFIAPLFIKTFYKTMYMSVINFLPIINLGQILIFMSSLLLSVLLIISASKWQMIIQSIYAVVYFVLIIVLINTNGLLGVGYATVLAGLIKFLIVIIITLILIRNRSMKL